MKNLITILVVTLSLNIFGAEPVFECGGKLAVPNLTSSGDFDFSASYDANNIAEANKVWTSDGKTFGLAVKNQLSGITRLEFSLNGKTVIRAFANGNLSLHQVLNVYESDNNTLEVVCVANHR